MSNLISNLGLVISTMFELLGIKYDPDRKIVLLIWNPWTHSKNNGNVDGYIALSIIKTLYPDSIIYIYIPKLNQHELDDFSNIQKTFSDVTIVKSFNIENIIYTSNIICLLSDISTSDIDLIRGINLSIGLNLLGSKKMFSNKCYGVVSDFDMDLIFTQLSCNSHLPKNLSNDKFNDVCKNFVMPFILYKKYTILKLLEHPKYIPMNKIKKRLVEIVNILQLFDIDLSCLVDCQNNDIKSVVEYFLNTNKGDIYVWKCMISHVLLININENQLAHITISYDNDKCPLFVNNKLKNYVDKKTRDFANAIYNFLK